MNNKFKKRLLIAQLNTIDIDNYLTIVALEDELTVSFTNDIEYCINGNGNWKLLTAGETTPSINTSETLSFRGELTPISFDGVGTFSINKNCDLVGNCMSILFGDDASDNITLSGKQHAFAKLFYNCLTIKNVSNNFLPATTLERYCYYRMFSGCNSLITTPELPAKTLAVCCYSEMFRACTSLQTAPVLNATTLAESCYSGMFSRCSALVNAPELPATTLNRSCYAEMFYECTALVNAPILPAVTAYDSCYKRMFYSCWSLVNAPELPATEVDYACYDGMFFDCRNLTNPPTILPATTLAELCYSEMFSDCILSYAPELPATTLAKSCYLGMFSGSGLRTAPVLPATTLAESCYYAMFKDCLLSYAPELPATTLVESCYTNMFYGCSNLCYVKAMFLDWEITNLTNWLYNVNSTGSFVKNRNATWTDESNDVVPIGWTIYTDDQSNIPDSPPSDTPSVSGTYTINLNNEWIISPYSINDMPVYQSNSNHNIGGAYATMYITINGYDTFKLYIRSYAETTYDYMLISQLDKNITGNTSITDYASVKAHTSGVQQGPDGDDISLYTPVEYTNIGGGQHVITIVYRKDNSVDKNDDRGYIVIDQSM